MSTPAAADREFDLVPADNERLAALCGPLDEHLRQIENRFGVSVNRRGNHFRVSGARALDASRVLGQLYTRSAGGVSARDVHLAIQEAGMESQGAGATPAADEVQVQTQRGLIRGRGANQAAYLAAIRQADLTFGVGPAGTGKTWLAVACAIDAMERDTVQRLVLTRPAVEAGERLGFLPGDLAQKVDPYLRPLYDALYDLMGFEKVQRLFEKQTIEIAPLAYMRGRTLNHSFVILDEAQNTTPEQMKMFLTRIGFGSKAVITGDPSQVDLPKGHQSGLAHAVRVLDDVKGIAVTRFTSRDVVRHPLVARIVDAYEQAEKDQP